MEPEIKWGGDSDVAIDPAHEAPAETPTEQPAPEVPAVEPAPAVVEPAAPVVETPATPEVPAPAVAAPAVEPAQPAPAAAPAQPVDSFAALGIPNDEYHQKLIEAAKTGDLQNFIKSQAVDYKSMTAQEILREDIRRGLPDLSEAQVERLLQKELDSKYQQGDYDDDDVAIGVKRMERDANKIREGFIAEQLAYKAPQITDPSIAFQEQMQAQQQQMEQEKAAFQQRVENDPGYKQFGTNRVVELGSGDDKFNYAVRDNVDVMGQTMDINKFVSNFLDPDGQGVPQFNLKKWLGVLAYANNPAAFEKALIDHGRTLGTKNADAELRNPDSVVAGIKPATTDPNAIKWKASN